MFEILPSFKFIEKECQNAGDDSPILPGIRSTHCVSLATSGLPIAENRPIVAFQTALKIKEIIPNYFRITGLATASNNSYCVASDEKTLSKLNPILFLTRINQRKERIFQTC